MPKPSTAPERLLCANRKKTGDNGNDCKNKHLCLDSSFSGYWIAIKKNAKFHIIFALIQIEPGKGKLSRIVPRGQRSGLPLKPNRVVALSASLLVPR